MHIEDITYQYGDTQLLGQLAFDESISESRPAVLIAHDAYGLGDHTRNVGKRLAELGYVTFALDYYGGGQPPRTDQLKELRADLDHVRGLGVAALETVTARPEVDATRVAAIGYCFGGTFSLELARSGADLRAVVGFHSGLVTTRPEDASNIKAEVLVCIGADDAAIPPETRAAFEQEMKDGGVDWQLHLYGGVVHSFTEPTADGSKSPIAKYDKRADERSWASMLELFTRAF